MADLMQLLQKEAPELQKAFHGVVQAVSESNGLDPKTKQLIFLGIKASQGDATSIKFHVPMLKKLGATRDEVKDAIMLTLVVCGLNGVSTCLEPALEAYDNA